MSIFRSGKKKEYDHISEIVTHDEIGEEVHILEGLNGEMRIKNYNAEAHLTTGKEYCPECHCPMNHKEGYWECDICKYSITDEESEEGEGCPTLEATYENDFGEYYSDSVLKQDIPEYCQQCGGPWPDCETSCKIFDD